MGCFCESKKNEDKNKNNDESNTKIENNPSIIDIENNSINKNDNINNKGNKLSLRRSIKTTNSNPIINETSILDHYTINHSNLIGRGGFGVIYSGTNKLNQNKVAIKIEKKKHQN